MIKTLYFDTETTGTDPTKHGLIQLACLIDIDGKIADEANWFIKPFKADLIEEKALEVNEITLDQLKTFPEPMDVYSEIVKLFGKYIDKYDPHDKFWPAGYNCNFDLNFLRVFFEKCGDKYFGSWQNWKAVDPLPLVRFKAWRGEIDLPDYKLGTVCDYYGIKLGDEAHDALADIKATRELIPRLKEIN